MDEIARIACLTEEEAQQELDDLYLNGQNAERLRHG